MPPSLACPRASRRVAVAVSLVSMTLLTGCGIFADAPAPVTTHVGTSGETVVAEWVDYPAHAGQDGEALLDYASQAELPATATPLMNAVAAAITEESGVTLVPAEPESSRFDDENWYPQGGNGYGGESLLITVNCCEISADSAPSPDRWEAVVEAAGRAAEESGLGDLVVDDQSERCGSDGGECWITTATATDGVQWVWISIQDAALDPTGDAGREAEEFGWAPASLSISYGATVVEAGKEEAFERAMQDFIGLERPAGTTSD